MAFLGGFTSWGCLHSQPGVTSTHHALQRAPKGITLPCVLWPTSSTVNVPFLLCLGLTHCWVSYTINIDVCFLCIIPAFSQSYLWKACTKLECIPKRKEKECFVSTTLSILQNDLVCSVLFRISKQKYAPKKPSSLKFHKHPWLFCALEWEVFGFPGTIISLWKTMLFSKAEVHDFSNESISEKGEIGLLNSETFWIYVHIYILSVVGSITFVLYSQEWITHKNERVCAFKFELCYNLNGECQI